MTAAPAPAVVCGTERWAVKTGQDPDASRIRLEPVAPATIAALTGLAAPGRLAARVAPTETTVYEVQATLVRYKVETGDSDYHLVLADGQGRTMIAEVPSPDCVGTSPFKTAITEARTTAFTRLHPGPSFRPASITVTVRGVGFFDFIHGQSGVAPNGIELHPVLAITFS